MATPTNSTYLILFHSLNRDHVVLVTVDLTEIIVTTTLGIKITTFASQAILAKFVDELATT